MIRLAVLGHPITHSRSPAIHNAALAAVGMDGVYRAIDMTEAGMARYADAVRNGEVVGANITMPYKELAYRLVDSVESDAERARSVNTWFRDGDRLAGASTDINGLLYVCDRRTIPVDIPLVVVGAGGAARAAAIAFADRDLRVMARRRESAEALVEGCRLPARILDWGARTDNMVVVNCTPVGMKGERLPPGVTDSPAAVVDMAYAAGDTPLVARAKAVGVPHADGIDVLVAQAADSFTRWTQVDPPLDAMEQAARNASSV